MSTGGNNEQKRFLTDMRKIGWQEPKNTGRLKN